MFLSLAAASLKKSRNNMATPNYQTFPLSHTHRSRIEREWGLGRFQRVDYDETPGPLSQCYWNVAKRVSENGGEAVYGWQILQWPDLFAFALHHAVWRSSAGVLVDVTEKYQTDPHRRYSTFIADDSIQVELDYPPYVDTKFHVFKKTPGVKKLIGATLEQTSLNRAVVKELRRRGTPLRLNQINSIPRIYHDAIEQTKVEIDAACAQCLAGY